MSYRPTKVLLGAFVAANCLVAQGVLGAGFYITELGTPGSLGTAGVANPTNTTSADASWTNPAGMTGIEDEHLLAGMQVFLPKLELAPQRVEDVAFGSPVSGNDGGNAGEIALVPSFFYVRPLSERARFGFSVTGPLGGGLDYGSGFVGRYSIKDVTLAGLAFTPSFGYRVNDRLSLGAGVSVLYTFMDQSIMLRQPGAGDARVKFEDLDDWGLQGVFGLTYRLTDRALLGVVYRTEADTDLEGDITVENLRLPVTPPSGIEISWTNPQWLDVGLRFLLNDKTALLLNAGWQEWSRFSKNQLSVDNGNVAVLDRQWDDTWYAGIAMVHKLTPRSGLSFGLSYDSSPVKDQHRTLDFPLDETWKFSASYAWEHSDKLKFALGGTLMLAGDAATDQSSQGVRVVGDFDSNWIAVLGGTLRYDFD
jgi:long-chain fatty acid transport protein